MSKDSERITISAAILALIFGLQKTLGEQSYTISSIELSLHIWSEVGLLVSGTCFLLFYLFSGMDKSSRINSRKIKQLEEYFYDAGILFSSIAVLLTGLIQSTLFIGMKLPSFSYRANLIALIIILEILSVALLVAFIMNGGMKNK